MSPSERVEFIAVALLGAPGLGTGKLREVLDQLRRKELTPANFLKLDDKTLSSHFGLGRRAVDALRHPESNAVAAWEALERQGVRVAVLGYSGYPERLARMLRASAPPVLFMRGNPDLAMKAAVGFCGSRAASAKGLTVASDCARSLAREGVNVVSGYARGVDLAAHRAALEVGGTTTMVLAEGISHFRIKGELRDVMDEDLSRVLVISEFPPGLPWRAHNAMARNRTICGLANAMVVIESGAEGGTFEAGRTALELGEPLFCVEYAEATPSAAGNPYFLQRGALGLRRAKSGEPNLTQLLSVIRTDYGSRDGRSQRELSF